MNTPLVSIIIPVYKVEKYVSKCIESIQAQTYPHWELLLINDGSPDGSGHICDEYSQQDSRIRVFHKENGGVSSARNLGLDNVKGDYVMFVDADDWLSDSCLEVCVNEIVNNQLDSLHFGVSMLFLDKKISLVKSPTEVMSGLQLVINNNFNPGAAGVVYRFDLVKKHDVKFPLALKIAEDQMFVLTFMKHAQRVKYIAEEFYFYYQREGSAVNTPQSKSLLLTSEYFMKFLQEWPEIKAYVDSMIVLLVINMVRNNDVPYSVLKDIYCKQEVLGVQNGSPLQKAFPVLAKINFYLACWVIYMYFSVKRIFSLDLKLN